MEQAVTDVLLQLIGGLVLFMYAVSSLSESLHSALGERATYWIGKGTKSIFTSILTGTIATALLDSSSAVIILTIVLVNAGLMELRASMGIVLGANIGTTLSSEIIAMNIGKYAPVFLLFGFVLLLVSKSERLSNAGRIILFFGVLFFGLYTMEHAVSPLRSDPVFNEWLNHTNDPLKGTLIGAMATLIIQSSSASVGMAIILTKKGLLSVAGGIAIMMGAELGTCSDTLLATIKGSRKAIKTGIFHLVFNLISIGIGLILFDSFVDLVTWISRNHSVERTVANAHVMFNVLGVFLFVGSIPFFERILNRILPDRLTLTETTSGDSSNHITAMVEPQGTKNQAPIMPGKAQDEPSSLV